MGIWAKWERATKPKGGTIRRRGKSCFPLPTFDFSFRADSADSKPLSAVQSPPIHARSFFPFFPFSKPVSCDDDDFATSTLPHPHTGDIPSVPPRHHNYRTNLMATTTAATSPFSGSQVPAALALTRVMGTHKPPCCHHPHCA